MKTKREDLTQAELKDQLHYDPDTGIFTRLKSTNNYVKVGDNAGSLRRDGYVHICLLGIAYSSHRLVWLYMTGNFPLNVIDHIDGNRSNNKFIYLRDITPTENIQNQVKCHSTNSTKLFGVHKYFNRFRSSISVNKKQIYLGSYPTPEEAHEAYLEAKRRLHPTCTI